MIPRSLQCYCFSSQSRYQCAAQVTYQPIGQDELRRIREGDDAAEADDDTVYFLHRLFSHSVLALIPVVFFKRAGTLLHTQSACKGVFIDACGVHRCPD